MTDQPIATVEAVAQHYTVTYRGITARIVRYGDRPDLLRGDVPLTPYLRVESVGGRNSLGATDISNAGSPFTERVDLDAKFVIGDDLDGALTRATKYAAAMCRVVADHDAALDKRNETNRVKVQLARGLLGAQA